MPRRLTAVVAAALCATTLTAAPVAAHDGNPDFESLVTDAGPNGLKVRVLSGDDRLEVRNDTGQVVTITGYQREPYARLLADGRVQVNERSPATYLNNDPRGDVVVPKTADAQAAPKWKTIESNGRFEFHDHRIHWMNDNDPPAVRDNPEQRQKVFDWAVPVTVGTTAANIRGTLWWRGSGGGVPTGAFIALGVLLLGAAALIVVVRRRRGRGDTGGPTQEAW